MGLVVCRARIVPGEKGSFCQQPIRKYMPNKIVNKTLFNIFFVYAFAKWRNHWLINFCFDIIAFGIRSHPFGFYYSIVYSVFQDMRRKEVKYSADAECEIISLRKLWNISLRSMWNEIRPSHLRSKYFTAKLFHLGIAKFHSPQANFVEKSTSALQMCFFLEASPRFELGDRGVADLCLTTWLWRRI